MKKEVSEVLIFAERRDHSVESRLSTKLYSSLMPMAITISWNSCDTSSAHLFISPAQRGSFGFSNLCLSQNLWNDRPSTRQTIQQFGSNVSWFSNCFTYSNREFAILPVPATWTRMKMKHDFERKFKGQILEESTVHFCEYLLPPLRGIIYFAWTSISRTPGE